VKLSELLKSIKSKIKTLESNYNANVDLSNFDLSKQEEVKNIIEQIQLNHLTVS
jgi:hypothetical protein